MCEVWGVGGQMAWLYKNKYFHSISLQFSKNSVKEQWWKRHSSYPTDGDMQSSGRLQQILWKAYWDGEVEEEDQTENI